MPAMHPFDYRRGARWDTAPDLVLLSSSVLAWESYRLTSRVAACLKERGRVK
jgi:hypothetical protein